MNFSKIPHVFLTNGGGVSEKEKALQLSQLFGLDIHPHQVILSHTPMRVLSSEYQKKNILVIGGKSGHGKIVMKE